jgi:predicted ABC-type ATPase
MALEDDGGLKASQQPEGLTPRQQMEHAMRLMERQLPRTSPMDRPRAVLTGGQPGSGKSYIVRSVGVQFEGMGGAVVVDPDEIRPTLPYMAERIAKGDLDIPGVANVDAGTIAYQMIQIAKREKRNVIVDGTLQNTGRAVDLADELRKAEYGVHFHGMAVYPGLSHARTYKRLEEQIEQSPTGFGRGVSDEFHDQAVKGYGLTVETFQKKASVNSMTFHYGDGARTVETRYVDGHWVPAVDMRKELEQVQERPTPEIAKETVETWSSAVDKMRTRGADAAEIARVDGFRQAAQTGAAATSHPIEVDEGPRRVDLSEPPALGIATLVHAGVRQAGHDARNTLMTVNWTSEEAMLEIRVPAGRGYERFTLPGHDRVETALAGRTAPGVLEIDFAETPPVVRDASPSRLSEISAEMGVRPADVGIAPLQPETRQSDISDAAGPTRMNAAMRAALANGRGVS